MTVIRQVADLSPARGAILMAYGSSMSTGKAPSTKLTAIPIHASLSQNNQSGNAIPTVETTQ